MNEMMTNKQNELIRKLWHNLTDAVATPLFTEFRFRASFDHLTKQQASQLIDILQRALDMEYLLSEIMATPKTALFGSKAERFINKVIEVAETIGGDDEAKLVSATLTALRADFVAKAMKSS